MIGSNIFITNRFNFSRGGGFDTDYQAILDYATTQGYNLPSTFQQIIQNSLVLSLKSKGIWNKLDILYIFANDAGSNFSTLNWKNPNLYQASLVDSPSFSSNEGFTGNGTSSYIDTNFNGALHGVNYTQNNASRFLYMKEANGTAALDGKAVAGINNMARTSTSFQRINTTSGLNISFSFDANTGMKSIHRTSSTNVELFNSKIQASRTATSAPLNNNSQLILRSGASYGAHTTSVYGNGASLVAENDDLVEAFDNYMYDINNLDSDYKNILNYATSQGFTLPSFSQRLLQNQLLVDLKSAGVWSKLDTFANFATDGDSNFALIDWKRLSQYTAVNSPTFTTNQGFKGNGTSSYIDTNFTPSTNGINYQLNNASRFFYGFDALTGARFEGNLDGVNNMRYSNFAPGYDNIKINSGASNLMSSGFQYDLNSEMKSIHRTSSTNIMLYNGKIGDSRILTSVGLPVSSQTLFRVGTTYVAVGSKMYAMGSSLVSENDTFVDAFDNYLNAL